MCNFETIYYYYIIGYLIWPNIEIEAGNMWHNYSSQTIQINVVFYFAEN